MLQGLNWPFWCWTDWSTELTLLKCQVCWTGTFYMLNWRVCWTGAFLCWIDCFCGELTHSTCWTDEFWGWKEVLLVQFCKKSPKLVLIIICLVVKLIWAESDVTGIVTIGSSPGLWFLALRVLRESNAPAETPYLSENGFN